MDSGVFNNDQGEIKMERLKTILKSTTFIGSVFTYGAVIIAAGRGLRGDIAFPLVAGLAAVFIAGRTLRKLYRLAETHPDYLSTEHIALWASHAAQVYGYLKGLDPAIASVGMVAVQSIYNWSMGARRKIVIVGK
jgi:hypothetical protein